jgi:hypothetical protein
MLAIPNQSGRRAADSVPIKPEDVYPLFIRRPRDLVLVFGKMKNVVQFKREWLGRRV